MREQHKKKVTKKNFFSLCKHKNLIFVWWLFIKKTQERNNEWGRNKNENKYEENLVLHDMKHAVECHATAVHLTNDWIKFSSALDSFFSKCSTDFIFTSTDQTFILFDSTIVSGFKFEGFIDVFSLMAISSKQEFAIIKICKPVSHKRWSLATLHLYSL